jgi:hypothetical protein
MKNATHLLPALAVLLCVSLSCTFKISLPNGPDKPGSMIGGEGQVTSGGQVWTGSGAEKYTLTPMAPCS